MNIYRLHIQPSEYDGEGEDHDEWFSSLRAARARRSEIQRLTPYADAGALSGEDLQIDRVTLADIPRLELALACLNRKGFRTGEVTVVVPPWYRPFPNR